MNGQTFEWFTNTLAVIMPISHPDKLVGNQSYLNITNSSSNPNWLDFQINLLFVPEPRILRSKPQTDVRYGR